MTKTDMKNLKTLEEKNLYIEKNLLDDYEKELLEELHQWNFKPVENQEEEKEKIKHYFKTSKEQRKAIHIKPSASDIFKIKVLASEKGMPYQTFINSALHQIATWVLKV